jgi:predicted CXXCH cytochrome family protein
MKLPNKLKIWTVLVLAMFCLGMAGCAGQTPPESTLEKDLPAIYASGVQPMKPQECGRCHPYFYGLIRTEGGKHRIDCIECHEEFHVYRPGKVEYEDILPKCDACHELVHGAELAQCLECHSEPHAPLKIPADRALEHGCHLCHPELDKEMKTYVTQHTEMYCHSCHHTRHGYAPACMECHQPHTKEMTQAECLACHPPHKALEVVYPEDIPPETCAGCHRNAYDMLKQSDTEHTALSCAKCHPNHREIIQCQECHPEPHKDSILRAFPVCGRCHGVAHSLLQ